VIHNEARALAGRGRAFIAAVQAGGTGVAKLTGKR
jgi:hypothetical protein